MRLPSARARLGLVVTGALATSALGCAAPAERVERVERVERAERVGLAKLDHIVIIYLENHSFDNLYGEFPGADGLPSNDPAPQVDATGVPYPFLPQDGAKTIPANLPNRPFNIDQYAPPDVHTPDLTHRFYHERQQINGGRMDRFVLYNDQSAGLAMGYYHTDGLPLAAEARKYTLCDRFFHAAYGGSFLNHQWLIAAQTPRYPGTPPAYIVSQLNADGSFITDVELSPDGYIVNTVYSVNHPLAPVAQSELLPNLPDETIGDRLSAANISWAWYAGGWNEALAGTPRFDFAFHHHPFIYYRSFADGTAAKAEHLLDETDFLHAAESGSLPQVAWVKPSLSYNEHPSTANIIASERHVLELIDAVRNGPAWPSTAIIVVYDESGGYWDHVAPPAIDRWGLGARVPALVISPYAKKGAVDHTQYDTTSLLALIEHRYNLAPLTARDAAAADLSAAFDFNQSASAQ